MSGRVEIEARREFTLLGALALGVLGGGEILRALPLPDNSTHAHDERGSQRAERRGKFRIARTPAPQLFRRAYGTRADRFVAEEPAQLVRQFGGGLKTLGRFFLQALQADRLQIDRDARIEQLRRDRIRALHLRQDLMERLCLERRPAREHLIENRAERIHVARRAERAGFAGGLFGRHVRRRAEGLTSEGAMLEAGCSYPALGRNRSRIQYRASSIRAEPLGKTEIGNARLSSASMRMFDGEVAMDNAALVRVMDRLHGLQPGGGAPGGQGCRGRARQGSSLDQFHRENCWPSISPTS